MTKKIKKNPYQQFIFQQFTIDKKNNSFDFFYSLDDKINFKETISFPHNKINWKIINADLLHKVLFAMHLNIGISYFKTYCPKKIEIRSGVLNKSQANFWNKIYTNGLGEFYFRNKIDFRDLVHFPYRSCQTNSQRVNLKNRALCPVGGGKDSIVTAELLKKNNIDFTLISLRDSIIQKDVSRKTNRKRIIIERELSSNLFELNKQGAYNGHTPVSIAYMFSTLLACVLFDYKYVVFSNEQSASVGNTKYLGQTINHQYSKSLEAEKNVSNYIKKYITPDVEIFSLLQPISELKIVELFSAHKKYFPVFSSCNRNFTIDKTLDKRWCGECAKCAFVFSQLSAFINKKELIKIFGKNLYADKTMLGLYLELLGKKNIKPFDCVGTPEEVEVAMHLAWEHGEYQDDYIMKYFTKKILPEIKNIEKKKKAVLTSCGPHNIPKEFNHIMKSFCD